MLVDPVRAAGRSTDRATQDGKAVRTRHPGDARQEILREGQAVGRNQDVALTTIEGQAQLGRLSFQLRQEVMQDIARADKVPSSYQGTSRRRGTIGTSTPGPLLGSY